MVRPDTIIALRQVLGDSGKSIKEVLNRVTVGSDIVGIPAFEDGVGDGIGKDEVPLAGGLGVSGLGAEDGVASGGEEMVGVEELVALWGSVMRGRHMGVKGTCRIFVDILLIAGMK